MIETAKNKEDTRTEKQVLIKTVQYVFKETTDQALVQGFVQVYTHVFNTIVGVDPFEVLLDDPKLFYKEGEKMFGHGMEIVMKMVGKNLKKRYGVNYTSKEFLKLLVDGDETSKKKLIEIWEEVARLIEKEAMNKTFNKLNLRNK